VFPYPSKRSGKLARQEHELFKGRCFILLSCMSLNSLELKLLLHVAVTRTDPSSPAVARARRVLLHEGVPGIAQLDLSVHMKRTQQLKWCRSRVRDELQIK
jgi:hypothetical protein